MSLSTSERKRVTEEFVRAAGKRVPVLVQVGHNSLAGPFADIHDDILIVAGGANFPQPVWENEKAWLDRIYVLDLKQPSPQWRDAGQLPRPIAYGAAVSTPDGVVCMGGADAATVKEISGRAPSTSPACIWSVGS